MNTLRDLQARSVVVRRERSLIIEELEKNDALVNQINDDERAFFDSMDVTSILRSVENKSLAVTDAALLLNREACTSFINFKEPQPILPTSVAIRPAEHLSMFSEISEWEFGEPWFRVECPAWEVCLTYERPFLATKLVLDATESCQGRVSLCIGDVNLTTCEWGQSHVFRAKHPSDKYTMSVSDWKSDAWISCISIT